MSLAFKENCPDLRTTRVVDIAAKLKANDIVTDVHVPWVDPAEARCEYRTTTFRVPESGAYDAIILAVAHRQFPDVGPLEIAAFRADPCILYDLKSIPPVGPSDLRL